MSGKAVVLFSGGLDSATVLAIAQSQKLACYALSCSYGQRHHSELQAAKALASKMGVVEHRLIQCDIGQLGGSSLTNRDHKVPDFDPSQAQIPSTYVPARNTLFLAMALGWAEVLGAEAIYAGMSAVDYSGYPDCRPAFMTAFQQLIDVATKATTHDGRHIQLLTPLLHLSKAQTIIQGIALGLDYAQTVSCYQADAEGKACGHCDSCGLRRRGFEEAGIPDPTRYYDRD